MYYLKYRPQTIAQLDNARIRETLGKALLENNFSHAYLLLGTRGSGKTTTARLIAKIVNCQNRKKGEEPCNKCDSCLAIINSSSLDVIEIDAASNTGVEDIRDLREKVKLAPSSSKYKVYIIDEVHMLSTSAFNALLKTLEEPPEHVIFVLATTDPQKLPPTIVSRCLVYDFGKGSREEIINSLKRVARGEKLEVSEKALAMIAQKASGSMRDGHKILEQLAMQSKKIDEDQVAALGDFDKVTSATEKLLEFLASKNSKKCLETVEEFVSANGQVKELIVNLSETLKNILLARSGIATEAEGSSLSESEILLLLDGLIKANSLLRDSPVPQLPLEMVIVEFCQNKLSPEISDRTQINSESQTVRKSDDPEKSDMPVHRVSSDRSDVTGKWPEILTAVKPYNHSLVALLRASRPKEISDGILTVEVFYKFHKDKLSEPKSREILEKVVSGIIGADIKIKFILSEGK